MRTNLVLDRMKEPLAELREVLVDILVWQVACDEDAWYQALWTSKLRQRTCSLPLL